MRKMEKNIFLLRPKRPAKMLQCFQHPHTEKKAFIFILSVSLFNFSPSKTFSMILFIFTQLFFLHCSSWYFLPRLSFFCFVVFVSFPKSSHSLPFRNGQVLCLFVFLYFWFFLKKALILATQLFLKMFALAMTLLNERKSQRNGIKWITFQLLTCHFYLVAFSLDRARKVQVSQNEN